MLKSNHSKTNYDKYPWLLKETRQHEMTNNCWFGKSLVDPCNSCISSVTLADSSCHLALCKFLRYIFPRWMHLLNKSIHQAVWSPTTAPMSLSASALNSGSWGCVGEKFTLLLLGLYFEHIVCEKRTSVHYLHSSKLFVEHIFLYAHFKLLIYLLKDIEKKIPISVYCTFSCWWYLNGFSIKSFV